MSQQAMLKLHREGLQRVALGLTWCNKQALLFLPQQPFANALAE